MGVATSKGTFTKKSKLRDDYTQCTCTGGATRADKGDECGNVQ